MARKKKADEGGGGAYWMDTYGDMITLVLTFFVLLFSMSTIDAAKWEALVATLTGTPMAVVAPLNPGRSIAPDPADQEPEPMTPEQVEAAEREAESVQNFDNLYQQIVELVEQKSLESMLLVERRENEIMMRFVDSMLFDTGSDNLKTDSLIIVTDIVDILEQTQEYIRLIHIEGHTDNRPINNQRFHDNWDLSALRATSVGRFIMNHSDIDRTKFSVAGRGEEIPIDTNETEEGRARNRRVDIRVERDVIESDYMPYPNQEPGATAPPRTQELWDDMGN